MVSGYLVAPNATCLHRPLVSQNKINLWGTSGGVTLDPYGLVLLVPRKDHKSPSLSTSTTTTPVRKLPGFLALLRIGQKLAAEWR